MQWKAKTLAEDEVADFRKGVSKFKLEKMMIHGSYLLNMASNDEELRAKVRAAIKEELRRADFLGIDYLVIHPGSGGQEGTNGAIERISEMVNDTIEESKATILLETGAGQGYTVGHTFEQLAQMIDGVNDKSRVAVCFDTCHVFVAGYDIKTAEGYMETMDNFNSVVGLEKLKAFHLNDTKKERGSRLDRHEQIGKGKLGSDGIANFLNDMRFREIPFVMETPKGEEGYMEDIEEMKKVFIPE